MDKLPLHVGPPDCFSSKFPVLLTGNFGRGRPEDRCVGQRVPLRGIPLPPRIRSRGFGQPPAPCRPRVRFRVCPQNGS